MLALLLVTSVQSLQELPPAEDIPGPGEAGQDFNCVDLEGVVVAAAALPEDTTKREQSHHQHGKSGSTEHLSTACLKAGQCEPLLEVVTTSSTSSRA